MSDGMAVIARRCPTCDGSGKQATAAPDHPWVDCLACDGDGEIVPASQLWGAVEALRDLADAAHRDRSGFPLPYEEWRAIYDHALSIVNGGQ